MWSRFSPSPAMVVALISLFVSLSGVSYAATQLIGTRDIKNGAVTAPKLARNAVTNPKIRAAAVTAGKLRDAAVTSGKLSDQAVTAGKLADGAVESGKLADQAVTAAKLANAAVTGGKLATVVARVTEVSVASNTGNAANATCQSGERLIGGAVRIVATVADDVQITASRPIKDNGDDPANGETFTQWRGAAFNQSGSAKTLRVFALCLQ